MKKNGRVVVDGFMMMKIVLFFLLIFIKYIILLKDITNIILIKILAQIFGCLVLNVICLKKKNSCNICKKDDANKCFIYFEKDYEINGGEKKFQTEELEVFRII